MSLSSPPAPSSASSSAFAGPVALCLLILMIHMAISGGRVAVALTALELKRSTFEVGILIAVFALLPMLLSVKAGQLLDRIGPWRPMRASAFVVIIGIALPLFWQHFIALIISAVCVGVGHMIFQIAVQRQMGLSDSEDRLRHFSWLSLSMATSGLLGPLLAGVSIDYLGYRVVFGLLAISPILCVFGLYRARHYLKTSHQPPLAASSTSVPKQSVTDLVASPKLRRVYAANMLLSSAWDTHMFVIPIFGVMVGLSATTIGLILAAFSAATIVVRLALPWLQHRVRPWQLIHFALLATGLNFVLYPFFEQVWMLMTLSFVLGLGLGSTQPSILALLQQNAPVGRAGEAFGLRMALINGCQVTLPLAFGALGAVIGIMPLFWLTAAGLGAGRWFTRHAETAGQTKDPPASSPPTPPSQPPSSI